MNKILIDHMKSYIVLCKSYLENDHKYFSIEKVS